MKNKLYLILAALIASGVVYAKDLNQSILASTSSVSQVTIQKHADFLAVRIMLTSTKDSPDNRVRDLQKAKADLLKKAEDNDDVTILEGHILHSNGQSAGIPVLNLSTDITVDLKGNEIKDGAPASLTFYAVTTIDEKDDFLIQSEILGDFVDRILLGSVDVSIGMVRLGIDNPEQYRAELLKEIMTDIKTVREACEGQAVIHVNGMDRRIQARMIDNTHVDLFIPYYMNLELYDPEGLLPKTLGRTAPEE